MKPILFLYSTALVMLGTSCQTGPSEFHRQFYEAAMARIKKEVTTEGIPRQKIFYNFQLDGVPSERRGLGGMRGGYRHSSETWHLPDGVRLTAENSYYIGKDFTFEPLKAGETFFMERPPHLPKEDSYKEAPLVQTFQSLELRDKNKNLMQGFYVPRVPE